MASTITGTGFTTSPDLIEGWEAQRDGGAIIHPIIGRALPNATLRPGGARSGRFTLFYISETAAVAAFNGLAAALVFTLATDERDIGMKFVVPEDGEITIKLDDETRDHWHVTVSFQEVAA